MFCIKRILELHKTLLVNANFDTFYAIAYFKSSHISFSCIFRVSLSVWRFTIDVSFRLMSLFMSSRHENKREFLCFNEAIIKLSKYDVEMSCKPNLIPVLLDKMDPPSTRSHCRQLLILFSRQCSSQFH